MPRWILAALLWLLRAARIALALIVLISASVVGMGVIYTAIAAWLGAGG